MLLGCTLRSTRFNQRHPFLSVAYPLHLLVGVIVAMLAALPLGPVNLAIVQATLNRGRRRAFLIATGSALAELFWVVLAIWGTSLLFRSDLQKEQAFFYLKLFSIPLLFLLGSLDLTKRIPRPKFHIPGWEPKKRKKRSYGAFWVGVSLNLLNPVLLPFWLGITGYLQGADIVSGEFGLLSLYALGVMTGTFLTGLLIMYLTRKRNKRMKYRHRVYITRGIGFLFLGFAIWQTVLLMRYFLVKILNGLWASPLGDLLLSH